MLCGSVLGKKKGISSCRVGGDGGGRGRALPSWSARLRVTAQCATQLACARWHHGGLRSHGESDRRCRELRGTAAGCACSPFRGHVRGPTTTYRVHVPRAVWLLVPLDNLIGGWRPVPDLFLLTSGLETRVRRHSAGLNQCCILASQLTAVRCHLGVLWEEGS